MKDGLLTIGRMSRLNHVSIPTLRLYDRLGLLKPRYVDPETGYRYYDIQQNARLDMITYMKELGMSLAEIGDIFQKRDIGLIEEILARKNEQCHQQMRVLKLRHNAVERAIDAIERYRMCPTTGTIALEYIDRRMILGIPCRENFYEKDIRSYEAMLLELRENMTDAGIPQVHSYAVGTSIRLEDFEQGNFEADEIFIFADTQVQDICPDVQILESGMFACIYLDSYDDEIDGAMKLLNHCRAQNWTLAGDYICEVMTEFNVFEGDRRNMFLRLQVPVVFLNR
ncbi:MAG: MerR family transcriptional regulator [Saccharofermentanales bacterium]|jgi:DNA-binding transcriptional MerR regulator